jgi:hypothetical protein
VAAHRDMLGLIPQPARRLSPGAGENRCPSWHHARASSLMSPSRTGTRPGPAACGPAPCARETGGLTGPAPRNAAATYPQFEGRRVSNVPANRKTFLFFFCVLCAISAPSCMLLGVDFFSVVAGCGEVGRGPRGGQRASVVHGTGRFERSSNCPLVHSRLFRGGGAKPVALLSPSS